MTDPKPGPWQLHVRTCYLLGVTDPDDVSRLWDELRAEEATRNGRR